MVAREHGRYVVTSYYGPADELVFARLYDHPATEAERAQARRDLEHAVFAAGGAALSADLLPD